MISFSDPSYVPSYFSFQWHITERCNWQCRHCYQEEKISSELNLEQLLKIFDQLLNLLRKWRIPPWHVNFSLTGGEPFLREDFFSLLKRVAEYSNLYRINILTNGSLLTEENIRRLREAKITQVQLSLEGMEKNNDEIRGRGAFKKTMEAMKMLVNYNVPVQISFTIHKKNKKDLDSLIKICEKLGAFKLKIRRFVPWGRGKAMEDFILQPQELNNCYQKIENFSKEFLRKGKKIKLSIGCEAAIFNKEIFFNSGLFFNFCGVTGGRVLTVMPNGDVLSCRRLPIVFGNALEDNLYDIYYSDKMRELRNLNNLHIFCKECPFFPKCFGGAKCVTYAHAGRLDVPDIQCPRAYKKLDDPNFK